MTNILEILNQLATELMNLRLITQKATEFTTKKLTVKSLFSCLVVKNPPSKKTSKKQMKFGIN